MIGFSDSPLFIFSPIYPSSWRECRITCERIIDEQNMSAPNIDPKGMSAVVSESLFPAIMAVSTSGAPLANAKKVTPATVCPMPTNRYWNYRKKQQVHPHRERDIRWRGG